MPHFLFGGTLFIAVYIVFISDLLLKAVPTICIFNKKSISRFCERNKGDVFRQTSHDSTVITLILYFLKESMSLRRPDTSPLPHTQQGRAISSPAFTGTKDSFEGYYSRTMTVSLPSKATRRPWCSKIAVTVNVTCSPAVMFIKSLVLNSAI
jgi:hypothetical protein